MTTRATPPPTQTAQPWYREAFGEDYLALYDHRDAAEAERAVAFLIEAMRIAPEERVLDLCCGAGRHLAALTRVAPRCVGLDLSQVLLRRAWADLAAPRLIRATMRRLPLADASFDHVVNLFTSFGYYEDEAGNRSALREMARVLRPPKGRLVLDHINRNAMLESLKPHSAHTDPDGRRVVQHRRWDATTRRVVKEVTLTPPDGGPARVWSESVRVYEADELEEMLRKAGLEPMARYGDYDGSAWRRDSPRMMLVARKIGPLHQAKKRT